MRNIGKRLTIALLSATLLPQAGITAVEVGYLFSDGQMPVTIAAYRRVLEETPSLSDELRLTILTESTLGRIEPEALLSVDVLVYDVMNEQLLERFDAAEDVSLVDYIREGGGSVLGVGQGLRTQEQYEADGVEFDPWAAAFWSASGIDNHAGLLKLALARTGVTGLEVPVARPALDEGYYYPDGVFGQTFASFDDFQRWRRDHGKLRPTAPRVAVAFYRANLYGGEMAVVDALVAELEALGAEVLPYFGYPSHTASARLLKDADGEVRADVILAFLFRFAQPDSGELLAELDLPIVNLITLYGRSAAEWESSATGLSLFEGTFQVAVPELAGLVAPTVVGSREQVPDPRTGLTIVQQTPIAAQIKRAAARALNLAVLRKRPNAEKRLGLLYYQYPAGAANVGASYLNVAESLATLLNRLQAEGYDVGRSERFDAAELERRLAATGNVAGYAPGDLAALRADGNTVRVDPGIAAEWLTALAPTLRDKIVADWGAPEHFELMTDPADGKLLLPSLRFGKMMVMPQPARGWGEDNEQLYHADDLAPHFQYLAAYRWLTREFGANAVIHLGTHGTLEWLDGKDTGLSRADAPDALLDKLPNVYAYNVDVVGEGLIARRRGGATLIDHMVPPFVSGGAYGELATLSERVSDYHRNLRKNPELAVEYAEEIRKLIEALGIDKDLGFTLLPAQGRAVGDDSGHEHGSTADSGHYQDARDETGARRVDHDLIHTVQDYLSALKAENVPYGLHALGRAPEPELISSTAAAIVAVDASLSAAEARSERAGMETKIRRSADRELDRLLRALRGGYVAGGTGGDPVRNPNAYPTGKNFYGIDPDKVPTPAAWRLGAQLADELLARHRRKEGRYPEKVSFVIWGAETMRHEGVLEAQIFSLLGTRPVWDARDKVVDVEVIDREKLGRPRVDIVIASAAEGMFHNVTLLLDKAVQLVKALDEPDNAVRRNYLATREVLLANGYPRDQADRRAAVRIFDEAPGSYNLNVSRIVEASGTWDSNASFAHDYTRKLGHGFGNGFWGEPMEDVFRLAIADTETVVHSSSSTLYGALDNDDFYMYAGGLANAVGELSGTEPELLVADHRRPHKARLTGLKEYLGTEMRARYFNPRWIEGMQSEGYAGAREMRAFVEYLWGWDATTESSVDDGDWDEVYSVYVDDKHDLELEAFFDERSPFAFQDLTARLLEVVRKEEWEASPAQRSSLVDAYLRSVERHGVGCSHVTCGNPRLLKFLLEEARARGISEERLTALSAELEDKLGAPVLDKAQAQSEFAASNDARINRRNSMLSDGMAPELIDALEQAQQASAGETISEPPKQPQAWLPLTPALLLIVVLALLSVLALTLRRRRKRVPA